MRDLPAPYRKLLLARPVLVLVVLGLVLGFFAYHARNFRLDASAESLLLEDDRDLQLFREVSARYQTNELLIVTFSPTADLFSAEALEPIRQLRDELRGLEAVESVNSLLDVPLVTLDDLPLSAIGENVRTLEDASVDRQRAREELLSSPIYRDLVLSRDGQTTALLVELRQDIPFQTLLSERNGLLIKRASVGLTRDQRLRLESISEPFDRARESLAKRRHEDIAQVRAIIDRYRSHGVLHLGGVPMIADDMITFIRNDLITFGLAVLAFIALLLTLIFREVRWVVLPLVSCFFAGIVMIGMLGLVGWEVSVISSNFIALMLIITISMNLHLAVRYRQLVRERPDATQLELVTEMISRMLAPCLYTAITTIIGFGSLVFSGIKPVIDFGWMMSIGLAVAFLTSFTLFPALLLVMPRSSPGRWVERGSRLTASLAGLTERRGGTILAVSAGIAVLSVIGISQLTVENSFIDYFTEDTEIYQGMKLIDEKLGGTTPLQVLLHLGPKVIDTEPVYEVYEDDEGYDDYFDEWEVDVAAEPAYWFTPLKVERIKLVHDYFDSLPEVGKVLSLASGIRVAEQINGGEFTGLELSVLYKKLPDSLREVMIDPYVSFGHNEARIMLRILDSQEDLRRGELLERIEDDLRNRLELGEDDVTVTGTLVLYNNMLQSLYRSQISSLGAVLLGIALMFMILFRSVRLSIIGIVPNVLAAGAVLGLMGLAGIPLDLMTITIAAITIGIAVDNAIHYIFRFRDEYEQTGDYVEAMRRCHASVGRAVLYTSSTIVFGFSILSLSNFFPTIYFGALTSLAMLFAFLGALTLVPKLILVWKPFD